MRDYFELTVSNICGRLSSKKFGRVSDFDFRLVITVNGECCIIRFGLDLVDVMIYNVGNVGSNKVVKIMDAFFKCDFVNDCLVEDRVVKYLGDNFGRLLFWGVCV